MSALERILDDFAALGSADAGRQAAAQLLREHGLPTRGEENWRYANLRALENVPSFLPTVAATAVGATAGSGADALQLPAPLPGFARLVLVDGRVRADLATPDAGLAQMLTIGTPARPEPPEPAFDLAGDGRLGLIATAFAPEPLTLKVAAGLKLELISLSSGSAGAGYLQLDIEVLPEARLELVERHLGIATTPALGCVQVRLGLGAGATVTHQRLLASAPDSVFIDSLSARLGANAHYAVNQVSVGASTARSSAQVRLQGHGATLQWHALAAAHGRQVNDALLSVLHEATATRTEQMFRGIASDSARVACNSDVVVAATAAGTKVAQSLRGLIDGDGAEVDLRPRLTIHTDDIQASHGATTGRLDEDLLFYLLSRGLAADEARALLKWAFLGEVLKSVEPAPLRRAAELATATRLRDAPAAELLQ